MPRSTSNKLKPKLLILHEKSSKGQLAGSIAEEFNVTRQAIQWLLHTYSQVDWKVLPKVRDLEDAPDIPEKYKNDLARIRRFLENLP